MKTKFIDIEVFKEPFEYWEERGPSEKIKVNIDYIKYIHKTQVLEQLMVNLYEILIDGIETPFFITAYTNEIIVYLIEHGTLRTF